MGFSTDLHSHGRRVIAVALLAMIFMTPAGAVPSRTTALPPADFRSESPSVSAVMPSLVLDGNPQNVQIQFTDPPLDESVQSVDGIPYTIITMSGEGATGESGAPELPQVSRLIMIGNTGNVEAEVVAQSFNERQTPYLTMPVQHEDSRSLDAFVPPSPAVYAADEWYPPAIATISRPATLRDVRFVVLTVYPVQVNHARQQMRVYNNIEVRIANTGGFGENEIRIHPTSVTPDFKKLYRRFENFEGSALDALPVVPGKALFICDSLPQIVTQVQKLIDWKRRKGIDATMARMQIELGGATSATQMQTYIANQYAASNGELEFVGIVGDATTGTPSAWSLPTFTYSSYPSDNDFGTISGGGPHPDPLPDIAIGRLSARNLNQLANLVNKIISYESDPDMSGPEWLTRGWLAAHTDYAPSNITTLRYSQNLLVQHGFTTVRFDTFPGDMIPDTLRSRLTEGLSLFNHRMSWIGEMDASMLSTTNAPATRKLPFVLAITCATGTFTSEPTLSEKWIRPVDDPVVTEFRGAIACIGMAGAATHTRYNNILNGGIMFGMYALDAQTTGAALIAGKLELYRNYNASFPDKVAEFCHYANLMGDPSIPVWKHGLNTPTVTAPGSVAVQTNNIAVSVAQSGQPVEGACVALVKGTETFARGYTNAGGYINLPVTLPATGNLLMTITHETLIPVLDTISVDSVNASLSYASVTVNDNNHGDGDGILNPGEIVDVSVQLQNTGMNTAVTGISGTLSTPVPGITILEGTRGYADIAVGASGGPASAFTIQVGAVFDNEPIPFHLLTTSSAGTHDIRFDLTPRAPDVTYVSRAIADANNKLDPGETNNMTVTFTNSGSRALMASCAGILRSLDSHVTVNDSTCVFGAVTAGGNGTNSSDYFNVTADAWTRAGYVARMQLIVTDETGFRDSVQFADTIGTAATTSPTGPDAYGYYAYDDTETQPAGAATTYDWLEIHNNGGTSLNFHDAAANGDASAVVALPFGFKYYGEVFDEITICSNGWIAFGDWDMNDFRNYHIGSPVGPPNQIAGYWDDLKVTGADSNVYYKYESGLHAFVVEWRARTMWTNLNQFFQIILYDSTYYPTPTGDGKIKIQYQIVTPDANQDPSPYDDNPYASVGIQNADHTDGLEYCFWNAYTPGSATLANERAIIFTTDVTGYMPMALSLMSPNGGQIWFQHQTATVTWLGGALEANILIELSRNGTGGPWETITSGTTNDRSHSFTISGPPSNTCRIRIAESDDPSTADTSDAHFTIQKLTVLTPNGGDVWMADSTETITWQGGDPAGNVLIEITRGGSWQTVIASTPNTGSYSITASQPTSETCRVRVTSLGDATDTDESDAVFSILVLQNVFVEGFESGAAGWTHTNGGTGWVDNWHISTERASAGTRSYKCGATDASTYAMLNDAWLTSPVINDIPQDARMRFYMQLQSEYSSVYRDSAYDGGLMEISVNGGTFGPLTPVGGYPKTFRRTRGGSRPAYVPTVGRPCWADTTTPAAWAMKEVDLSAYDGQSIQIRFRFVSDSATHYEGWYVDDVTIAGAVHVPSDPVTPVAVTITVSGSDLTLRWNDDGNLFYRIYTSGSANGPWETYADWWTTSNQFTITGGASAARKFYYVAGWDGN